MTEVFCQPLSYCQDADADAWQAETCPMMPPPLAANGETLLSVGKPTVFTSTGALQQDTKAGKIEMSATRATDGLKGNSNPAVAAYGVKGNAVRIDLEEVKKVTRVVVTLTDGSLQGSRILVTDTPDAPDHQAASACGTGFHKFDKELGTIERKCDETGRYVWLMQNYRVSQLAIKEIEVFGLDP